ncbi:hypothetical protein AGDE_04359 [Angomonas deanei]|nr:hypothetical protein AGDE_05397 [Angomonas deanei]EPY39569.1 hypothetical protein AGDE_04359 [Angomonas deanei]|eukprot:EPY38532.1 hypothetical protein AGDE_05397 [Angomonas deanei]
MYVFYIVAYASGIILFITEYDNYWAAGGFAFVPAFIIIRIGLFLTPIDVLWRTFPPKSFSRAFFQAFWFAAGWAGIGIGLWLMARGIQNRQGWTGDSYFCGMTGAWMAAKWCFFLTVPIFHLRADNMTLEQQKMILGETLAEERTRLLNEEPISEIPAKEV